MQEHHREQQHIDTKGHLIRMNVRHIAAENM